MRWHLTGADTSTSNLASVRTGKKTKQTLAGTSDNPNPVKKALTVDTMASALKCTEPLRKRAKCEQVDTTQKTQINKDTSSSVEQGPLDKYLVAKSSSKVTLASRRRPSSSKVQGVRFENDLIDIPACHLALVIFRCLWACVCLGMYVCRSA